ncbi:hypothetical protein DICPUDRAFT_157564 [Dictyostelium purpureum]|uniref:FNIP repeat-containing protein n=1 Tax=Dictyostelium purpureum TaxID=5786 RepID=F0ZZG0_DICPU|nr:uncharacterized protein DICPUDRAFT_157564 [Dictyostelium purpureum]EGC30675.1 hypothetical protein DICPUDRAFT_157564 [Dictyostelium purpureum]|eukprot:XP_003292800.1 hypothetical protein DICPUDRAFT_157564 [Dictyostelium purpureum]
MIPSWIKTLDIYIINSDELSIIKNAVNIERLYLRNFINHNNIKKDMLPMNLKKLFICFNNANKKIGIESGALPESLTNLIIQNNNNSSEIDHDILPKGLLTLELSSSSNEYFNIPNYFPFPQNLKYLFINCKTFNFQLPIGLKELIIYTQLNYLNDTSNKPVLPKSLEKLTIKMGTDCEIPLDHKMVPINLKYLKWSTNSIIDSFGEVVIPRSLEHLEFTHSFSVNQKPSYPPFNLKLLPHQLPITLKYISFDDKNDSFENGGYPLMGENIFPQSITYINFGASFNQNIGSSLSKCFFLKTVIFGVNFNQILQCDAFPPSLQILILKNPQYKHLIQLKNKKTLVKCCNIENYLLQFENDIKSNCELYNLCIPLNYKYPLSRLNLKNKVNLEYLEFDLGYKQPILPEDLPLDNNIKTVSFTSSSGQIINLEHFKKLQTIIINNDSNPTIVTTTTINNQLKHYNFYNLKSIEVSNPLNSKFLDSLDPIFYQFIIKNNNNFK